MRKKSFAFIFILISILTILPIVNISHTEKTLTQVKLLDKFKSLYNMDIIEKSLGFAGYNIGVSTVPNQVVIGSDGWLFLGNRYATSVVSKIKGYDKQAQSRVLTIAKNIDSWNKFFIKNGVKDFKIIIGPDKETIYLEHRPKWTQSSQERVLEHLIASRPDIYINTLQPMELAKKSSSTPLYFKTDTHWNMWGGAVAFNSLASVLKEKNPSIVIEKEYKSEDFEQDERTGGDLSKFLKIAEIIKDKNIFLKDDSFKDMPLIGIDYNTGAIFSSGHITQIGAYPKLVLFKSKKALNNYKVLWLRDSFGTAMSPYMLRTFSQVLQIHYGNITPKEIKNLVLSYKPDYVFITGVERDSIGNFYTIPMN